MRLLIRLLAALLGLVLAALGLLLAVECGWALARPADDGLIIAPGAVVSALGAVTWQATSVRLVAGGLLALGLVLLVLTARSGNKEVRLHDPAPEVTVTTDSRSLARLVGHQVRDQDGVAGATVTAGGKRVKVRATPRYAQAGDLRDRLTATAERAVHDLPLRSTPKVLVAVGNPKERR
ncbi:DUF6286 domain-containing protein [Saccharopolyspora griseoalba]|uniref:DUF6286 domain-containing protein n=1 Tax=Saccharopolyspora griseoalba TaxID=1431848 RepID=A0ABW2LSQ9_9PSEU